LSINFGTSFSLSLSLSLSPSLQSDVKCEEYAEVEGGGAEDASDFHEFGKS
jgi:hypothetical protein